jgi:hypothetical protein
MSIKLHDQTTTSSSVPSTPSAMAANEQIWRPAVNSTWQIVLSDPIKLGDASTSVSVNPNVDIFDIDLFDNPKSTVDALHKLGKKVIAYFSAGSFEPGRPDSRDFKSSDVGKGLDGWPEEKWLDLNSENVRDIMSKRIELAAQKGFDAIDPDNIDGYVSADHLRYLERDSENEISDGI